MTQRFPHIDPAIQHQLNRRAFLGRSGAGLGTMALASLLPSQPLAANEAASAPTASAEVKSLPPWRGVVRPLHQPAKVKRVIYLYMAGGPSHLETFDYKPKLAELHGQKMPDSFTAGKPIAQLQGQKLACMAPIFKFDKYGQSGQQMTNLFPKIAGVADQICIVRSMVTDAINHDPAHTMMNTGTTISGRPSLGSWLLYGLGSECDNLPGFVVLTSIGPGRSPQPLSTRMWHSGFLPGQFQGVQLRSKGDAVLYLRNPQGTDRARQQDVVQAARQLDGLRQTMLDEPEISARITQYETAFRMQTSVPGLIDLSDEPKHVLEAYGCKGADGTFGANCLLARRMAERGVRFIQLYHRDWDHHSDLKTHITSCANQVDKATAALIQDLKQRGMLDETLIVWGGEFGRTPMAQMDKGGPGRDHHMQAFSIFLCGGGIKPGITHGATDELGYDVVEGKVHVHDLHATMLHLLGIDHQRLTFRHQGRDFRLTDVAGKVVKAILA